MRVVERKEKFNRYCRVGNIVNITHMKFKRLFPAVFPDYIFKVPRWTYKDCCKNKYAWKWL